jgi:uncharacterized protein (TIGR03435 family)
MLCAVAAVSMCLKAQQQPPVFDVASVKPNHSGDGTTHIGHEGATLTMTNATLRYCILRAYGVADAQVSGPDWLDSERYDIIAKAADDAQDDLSALRLQALLADRFKLTLHRKNKEASIYALVATKGGPKVVPEAVDSPNGGHLSSGRGHVTAKAASMAHFAEFLSGPRAALGLIVIDQTGLTGAYGFDLDWTPDDEPARRQEKKAEQNAPPSLPVALQEKLGLRLDPRKGNIEMLIVDHAERIPTEN